MQRIFLMLLIAGVAGPCFGQKLAVVPPMGWNDWAHYQCHYDHMTIVSNAQALVKTGLAKRGYNTVTIDDCWMQKDRDSDGNLQPDPTRFPHGIKPVADAVHGLGLKFGIYEDAGSQTCGRFAGSGRPQGGGKDHFLQDTKLFASWGVDYLKLDGCNVYVAPGESRVDAYRAAYQAESAAIKAVGRPIVFSESAPAYFQGRPEWYDVLSWVGHYGELWREGSDVANYHASNPDRPRFHSVLWNYAYNLPLGRFQKPGNWNDADFIIGGDPGLTLAETRSQLALWSMMSAPLILSSDISKLSAEAIAILGNEAVIAVDQDPLGRTANLVRRGTALDVLFKPLSDGSYAVAVLNRGATPQHLKLHPADLGFHGKRACRLEARNLWSGDQDASSALQAEVGPHDTAIWTVRAASSCGTPLRFGTITITAPGRHRAFDGYTRCLARGGVEACAGTSKEAWTVTSGGALKSGKTCLDVVNGKPAMRRCSHRASQHWNYTLSGNLVAGNGNCLTTSDSGALALQACGHNSPDQIWSLPNPVR